MEKLRMRDPQIKFADEEVFTEFLDELSASDLWTETALSQLSLDYVEGGTPSHVYANASNEQVDLAFKQGSLTLAAAGTHYLMNASALFTLKDRAGLTCKLSQMLLRKNRIDSFCKLMNIGFSEYTDSTGRILVRAGQVLAVHSGNYVRLDQRQIFSSMKNCMLTLFPDAQFEKADYTHSLTKASYSLADYKAKIMEAYVDAWVEAGNSKDLLEDMKPVVEVHTSDTGEFCLEITPALGVGSVYYPLGDGFRIKHHGDANVSRMDAAFSQCYTKIQRGLDDTARLMGIEMKYPVPAMIRAATEIGMVKTAKKACKSLVEAYKTCLMPGEKVTAFDLYMQLCDIRDTSEFAKMMPSTRFKTEENLYRLLTLDWDALDMPGSEEV